MSQQSMKGSATLPSQPWTQLCPDQMAYRTHLKQAHLIHISKSTHLRGEKLTSPGVKPWTWPQLLHSKSLDLRVFKWKTEESLNVLVQLHLRGKKPCSQILVFKQIPINYRSSSTYLNFLAHWILLSSVCSFWIEMFLLLIEILV